MGNQPLSPFTGRLGRAGRSALPWLAGTATTLLGSATWMILSSGLPPVGAFLGAVALAVGVTTWTMGRVDGTVVGLRRALRGLPPPPDGWTRPESHAIERVMRHDRGLDAQARKSLLEVAAGVCVLAVLFFPVTRLAATEVFAQFDVFGLAMVVLAALVASGGLGLAWQADFYRRDTLLPLAVRVAQTQHAMLEEAAEVNDRPTVPESSRASVRIPG